MYVSKYYTNEEIDQRLLQGYFDDFVKAGFAGTINEFWAFVLSIANKVDKREGYDLSKNDFTDKLKEKLEGIEERANYITKLSQLENDTKFQTEEQVRQAISDLIDGADDALDTLKELAEALGNDPNFATTITNKLTDLRNALTDEVNRAKEEEGKLSTQIREVNSNFIKAVDLLNDKIDTAVTNLINKIDKIEAKVDKNTADIADLRNETTGSLAEAKAYAKDLVDKEAELRKTADDALSESIHQLNTLHINDKAELKQDIAAEAQLRANADANIQLKLTEEITNRQTGDAALESKLSDEVVNRKAADETLQNSITKEVADRTNADNTLQVNIDKEAQARESADQVLQTNINSEAATRTAQDQILDQKITALSEKTDGDKSDVLAAIEAEKEARIAADADLNSKKVDKREGYSLTKNDFTDLLLAKLNGIEEHANYITLVSQLANDAGYQTEAEVEAAIEKIIGSAPEVLDTLEEIAKALGDDPNFASTITKKLAAITEKVNQEIEDREAADVALRANITDEETARKEADAALKEELKEYVDNSAATGDTALQVVKDNLAKEIQDRKDADAILQANIDKETVDRKEADKTHTDNIAALTQRVSDLALSMQDAINTVKNELTAQVNANTTAIATNQANITKNSEAITAMNKTIADNYKEVKDMVNEEIVDRTNGDSNLSSRIDTTNIALGTETAERKAADQILQVNLDKEVGDRKSADTALETKIESQISNLSQQTSSEITRVEGEVTQEVKDREAADKTLSDRIDSLETGSTAGLNEVKAKIEANTVAINTEKDRATARENAIQANLDTAIANHKDEVNGLTKDISDEANTRLAGDTALQVNIDKEVADRKNADTLLDNKIAQEISDRTTAIQGLESKKVDKVDGKVLSSNDFTDVLLNKLNGIEEHANYITKVSELLNDSGFQTEAEVEAAIQKIIGSAPGVLDTLEEIAKALGDDPNFATTMTQKLNELTTKIETETEKRVEGDAALDAKLTTLSTTLTKTVEDLRTYVTETRTELLARANSQDALITQNAANIQRNLELIQSIQNNISGSYLEVKALLETEIAARKAEDIRLEGKIDQNTADLGTEREERMAADKALQDALDAEEAARTAADAALGVRIDTEIAERKAADKTLQDNIDAEEYARAQEDTRLNARIDKEVTDRTNADKELGTRIDNEEDAREAADTTLQDNIDAEETARTEADTTLQDNIDATNAHTINTHRLDSNPVLNGTDIKLDGYVKATGTTPADLDVKVTDTTSAAFGKVQKRIEVDKADADSKFNKVKAAVGLTNDLGMPALTDTNYMGGSVDVVDSLKKLDAQLEPIIIPAAAFNISASATSEEIAAVFTDELLNEIANNTTHRPYILVDTGNNFYQQFRLSLQLSGPTTGAITLGFMYELAGMEFYREFKRTAQGAWSISTVRAGKILIEGDVVNNLTAGGTKVPLSAEQGKALKALIDGLGTDTPELETELKELIQTTKTALEASIATEVQNRKDADTALDTKLTTAINKEVQDRTAADTVLGTRIDNEVTARKEADAALKTELTEDIQGVQDALDAFIATKAQASGLASLDKNGKVPSEQLPSYVDDVIDVYATYDKSPTGDLSNISLFADADHNTPITGEAGKIYQNVTTGEPGYQFRWTGTTWSLIVSGGVVIGEITGTAYDGAKGKTTTDNLNALMAFNPIRLISIVTDASKATINYERADGTGIQGLQIPTASSAKAGVMAAADRVKLDTTLPKQISDEVTARTEAINALQGELADDIAQEVVDRNSAIAAAKTELTTAINKEVSDRKAADTQVRTDLEAAVELVAEDLRGADTTLQNNITKEVNDRKGEITRVEELISDEAATRAQADTTVNAKVDSHIGNKSNPHGVTKAQVGLGNVNNTSDADKPVSTAQATAIADAKAAGTNAQTNLTTHIQNKSNPHGVTRDQLGLGTTAEIIFKKVSAPSGLWKESDERLKTFIKPLEHTLDEICSIPTDSFMIRGNHDIGTIAQTIEKYFPELVSENTVKPETVPNPEAFEKVEKDGETYILVKEVDYSKMSVLAIEGIKLLKAEIDELREKLLFTNLD
nr:MAG: chaperone of endosialidase [Bacteriophage sp.]